jgi:predicted nuclease with TOPRIM domain
MYEFTVDEPVDEMDEGDLRSTLTDFMQKHEQNVEDYRDVESDRDEFSDRVDDLEDEVADFSETEGTLAEKFAQIVEADTDLFDADELVDRFSLPELMDKADAMGAFTVAQEDVQPDADGEGEDGEGNTFTERPDRAPTGEGGEGEFSEEAESDLNEILSLD